MLRLWLNTPPLVHLLTLVLAVLCWWPGLSGDFLLSREALNLLHADAIRGDATLYIDAWLSGPPLMVWLYHAFRFMFGEYALQVLKGVFVVYLYLTAVTLPAILAEYRALKQGLGLASALTVVLAASPWFAQEVHSSLIALWPITMAFYTVIRLGDASKDNPAKALQAGLWLGLATWVSFRMGFWVVSVLVAYVLIRPFKSREVFAILTGWLMVGALVVFVLFLQGNLIDFWQTGILGYLDQVRFRLKDPLSMPNSGILLAWFLIWGPAIVVATFGFAHSRLRYFTYLVRIRKAETVVAVWLISGLALILVRFWRIDWSDILLLAPPTAFYAARVMELKWPMRFKIIAGALVFLFPLFQFMGYWGWKEPEQLGFLAPAPGQVWRGSHVTTPSRELDTLRAVLSPLPPEAPIWIFAQRPGLYYDLGRPAAVRYTDARLTLLKLAALPPAQILSPWTPAEPESETFRSLSEELPAAILDPGDWTPYLSRRYPLLFERYATLKAGSYTVLLDTTRATRPLVGVR